MTCRWDEETATIRYVYPNVKNIDIVDIEQRFHSSQLFVDPDDTQDDTSDNTPDDTPDDTSDDKPDDTPDDTSDGDFSQLKSAVTAILDEVAHIATLYNAG